MESNSRQKYITPEEAAARFMVLPADVLTWIKDGKLRATEQEDGKYLISLEDYDEFGSSLPAELCEKIGEHMWKRLETMAPLVQQEANERFRHSSALVLNRAEQAVGLLEKLHRRYEPKIDIFNDKRGAAASFIVYARVISLLYSIIALLRSAVPAESLILFRPLGEAILLGQYFMVSDAKKENEKQIRRWFTKEESPQASEVRNYLHEKLDIPIDLLRKQHNVYSKPVHHTYGSIMESYRGMSMSGFLGEHCQRMGFDYHQSSVMRDIVSLVLLLDQVLLSALNSFHFCFAAPMPLAPDDVRLLKDEIDFYSLETSKRLAVIFKNREDRDG